MKTITYALSKWLLAPAALAAMIGTAALAEDFPSKTIEVVTHAGYGGGTDVTTRMMMLRTRRELGQDMVLVNKKGGGGAASMDYLLTLEPDGHNVLAFTSGHAASMALGKTKMKLEDMRPLARGTDDPQILMVSCKQDFADSQQFVSMQKSKAFSYGVTHTGGIDDVSAFMFAKRGGLMTPKIVAYDGVGPMIANLIKGDIDVGVLNLAEAGGQIDAGEICPVVVMANERMAKIGDVPTAKELGIDASFSTVRGFVTLAGASDDHADVLEEKMLKAMGHKYYQGFLEDIGLDATSVVGADEWGEQMSALVVEMGEAMKELGYIQ